MFSQRCEIFQFHAKRRKNSVGWTLFGRCPTFVYFGLLFGHVFFLHLHTTNSCTSCRDFFHSLTFQLPWVFWMHTIYFIFSKVSSSLGLCLCVLSFFSCALVVLFWTNRCAFEQFYPCLSSWMHVFNSVVVRQQCRWFNFIVRERVRSFSSRTTMNRVANSICSLALVCLIFGSSTFSHCP